MYNSEREIDCVYIALARLQMRDTNISFKSRKTEAKNTSNCIWTYEIAISRFCNTLSNMHSVLMPVKWNSSKYNWTLKMLHNSIKSEFVFRNISGSRRTAKSWDISIGEGNWGQSDVNGAHYI